MQSRAAKGRTSPVATRGRASPYVVNDKPRCPDFGAANDHRYPTMYVCVCVRARALTCIYESVYTCVRIVCIVASRQQSNVVPAFSSGVSDPAFDYVIGCADRVFCVWCDGNDVAEFGAVDTALPVRASLQCVDGMLGWFRIAAGYPSLCLAFPCWFYICLSVCLCVRAHFCRACASSWQRGARR